MAVSCLSRNTNDGGGQSVGASATPRPCWRRLVGLSAAPRLGSILSASRSGGSFPSSAGWLVSGRWSLPVRLARPILRAALGSAPVRSAGRAARSSPLLSAAPVRPLWLGLRVSAQSVSRSRSCRSPRLSLGWLGGSLLSVCLPLSLCPLTRSRSCVLCGYIAPYFLPRSKVCPKSLAARFPAPSSAPSGGLSRSLAGVVLRPSAASRFGVSVGVALSLLCGRLAPFFLPSAAGVFAVALGSLSAPSLRFSLSPFYVAIRPHIGRVCLSPVLRSPWLSAPSFGAFRRGGVKNFCCYYNKIANFSKFFSQPPCNTSDTLRLVSPPCLWLPSHYRKCLHYLWGL